MQLIPSAHELISNMRSLFPTNNSPLNYLNEEPLRDDLLSIEQLEKFGKTLALSHKLSTKPAKEHLLKRLSDNELILNEVRKLLTESFKKKHQVTPAGEWLIDNFYLIEEHIRIAKLHFPKGYSKDLPQLSDHSSKGLTRIYDIVLQMVSHSDGRIDIDNLSVFINSYQTITNLKLGELWAIPIMLRLGLIENLRRVAVRVAIDRVDRNLANYWAKKMIEVDENTPTDLILIIADMARSKPPILGAFVSEITRQLRGKGTDLALALNWIEQRLSESGLTGVELVNAEIKKQAADQVSVSNSINSLRLLNSMDWREFIENHSIVEQILKQDISKTYHLMDFHTRDHYRHVVENIAKLSNKPEKEIAEIVIDLSAKNVSPVQDHRNSHVGYFLLGPGLKQTRNSAGIRENLSNLVKSFFNKHSFKIYAFIIIFLTFLMSSIMLKSVNKDISNLFFLSLIFLILLICTSQVTIAVVDFFATLLINPNLLPRMDFSKVIPSEFKTMVIIPAMLVNEEEIENLAEALEVRYLANRNENLHFGLLTDFTDASTENLPMDEKLLEAAKKCIIALNDKYDRKEQDLFYLFHRPRKWNPKQNTWMGRERKRGKLSDLNKLLRGNGSDHFSAIIGDQSIFQSVKYIITLDEDTQLPLGSAWKLIGSMAHPMNRPWYDPIKKRVTKGYGILQPRVTVSLPDISSSSYTFMHGNEPGIDPYTKASSDVYQDLFEEGSFIGKGIYDVDIFKNVLENKFADNSILSHDLLEGAYIRSGLLSDVQLFEKYPGSYRSDMKRRIRWTRGDWQIFAWFLPFVPDENRNWHANPLSALSRWKIFDNIRRSLFPIALTIFLILELVLSATPLFWMFTVTGIIVFPIFIASLWNAINKPGDVIFSHHIGNFIREQSTIVQKTFFTFICLPYEAISNINAISKTVWRMVFIRKNLLEWSPSINEEIFKKESLPASYYSMWVECFITLVIAFYIAIFFPVKLIIAGPIFSLWILSPLITWFVSKPAKIQVLKLSKEQDVYLRKLARKNWRFFETFITIEDNWLPPDNFQELPTNEIAHRTSPTNIGLSLLSNVTAYDFGYITTPQLLERTANVLLTMDKLEKYKGHLYNWYDTETLNPLIPNYISTVDSGNMAGALLTLKQGLLSIPNKKIIPEKAFDGLMDSMLLFEDCFPAEEQLILIPFKDALYKACINIQYSSSMIWQTVQELSTLFNLIIKNFSEDENTEKLWWSERICRQLEDLKNENIFLNPLYFQLSEIPERFKNIFFHPGNSTPVELLKANRELLIKLENLKNPNNTILENEWLDTCYVTIYHSIQLIEERIETSLDLAEQCNDFADMEWDFLFNKSNNLLTIGYNLSEHSVDPGYYDLLASEARLGVFICISQGKLPEASWFAMGRLLTNIQGNSILLSWSGSMFEYLMPLLIMPTFENTLLDQTYKAAVQWQIDFGKKRGLPWGISESGYNLLNANSNYQYRAFGAPGLGLKRGLEEDSVIAPYATSLALMVAPEKACENLELLSQKGFEGKYGLYEAIDYTPARLKHGETSAIVYSFMAHHQGMSFLSLAYLLMDRPMQKLFNAEPQFKATLLLLQERIPKASTFYAHTTKIADINYIAPGNKLRIITSPNTNNPEVQLLSNGRYHVMVTNAGAGYSRWNNLAVTRWREDGTRDNWGTFFYIRDVEKEIFWSNTHQPSLKKGDKYEAAFSQGRVDFRTNQNEIEMHTEIMVSAEDDIELRRLHLTNCSGNKRTLEITSYTEVVIATTASDIMQPAFSNLFVQTEINKHNNAIICTRRPRSAEEKSPWLFHLVSIHGKNSEEISFESDRNKFIGRGNSTINPQAMHHSGPLSGTEGSVLDPMVAIRYKISLEPEETVIIDLIQGIAESKENCIQLIEKYNDKHHKDRVFELAWTHSQIVLRQINASESEAQLYGQLASSIIFTNPAFRAEAAILINNHKGQSGLWGYSISGDLPIVLLKVQNQTNMHLVKQLIQAHAYWRLKGLAVDLVIWNEEHSGYRQVFQNEIQSIIPPELLDHPAGIFVRASDQISNEDRVLFQTVARINISDNDGTLAEHVKRKSVSKTLVPFIVPSKKHKPILSAIALPEHLVFFNGLGGFSPDGTEYIISSDHKKRTPSPWVNVIANPQFGTVISESGSSYTWIDNAHELRLTPWHDDPVGDPGGEAFYLRDEESGFFWSTTLLPAGGKSPYITHHGLGYSSFEHMEDGIYSEMKVFVDQEFPVKFNVIKIKNNSGRMRSLSVTGYIEWVLGTERSKTAMFIHTEIDPETGAIFAKNTYTSEFTNRIAFFDIDYIKKSYTGNRTEFLGRNGSLQNPEVMYRQKLSGKMGLALDPCGAIQIPFDLEDGEEFEIIFRLGTANDPAHAVDMVRKFRGSVFANESLEKVKAHWKSIVSAFQVETPDEAINFMTNAWLSYQTLSARLWGRTGFYQSGGAFGFRDQLQDVMSLLQNKHDIAREQILLCASHQFKEGDVQHWWHPPVGRGVRTHCADDFLWLPFVTSFYVLRTGDVSILDIATPYLDGRLLNANEESYYDLPVQSGITAKLYEHCVQAIRYGLVLGVHGLPLIGTGDWNDGFDKVGHHGKGESVWMGFFLYEILERFSKIARIYKDDAFADECLMHSKKLKENLNLNAWDGEWYKRAWFDNGTPLGSSKNTECRIDSISQSWSVLSGAGDAKYINIAMESAYQNLVNQSSGIIQLLEPPFDLGDLNPGYIKGYVPGVRENGGQYTHAAIWMIIAFAKLGHKERVWELLKMINPINHGKNEKEIAQYKVEPYVLAADVYACPPHAGRGGWTWYTGSSAWLYRLITEFFLGLQQENNQLYFTPCIPAEWDGFKVHYRYLNTMYHLEFVQISGPGHLEIIENGQSKNENFISLNNDLEAHRIKIIIYNNDAL